VIKYFHELTRDEFIKFRNSGYTPASLARDYPQPVWCSYPDATQGALGCWSLICGVMNGEPKFPISRNYCKNCNCYIKKEVASVTASKARRKEEDAGEGFRLKILRGDLDIR
jgi:hypothetical protein